jgi:ABC-type branched-subunit amino acid transport system ATPase component
LPAELNLHQRKFLEFARALASRPQVLMLDEVLSGLTPSKSTRPWRSSAASATRAPPSSSSST